MPRHNGLLGLLMLGAVTMAAAEPLPAEVYAAAPEADNVRLSPDGRTVVMISPRQGQQAVRLWHPDGRQDWLTPHDQDQLTWIAWKGNDRLLLGMRFTRRLGDRLVTETRLMVSGLAARDPIPVTFPEPLPPPNVKVFRRLMTPPPHVQDRVISLLPDDPDHILLAAAPGDWQHPQVMRVAIAHGQAQPMLFPTGNVVRWLADPDGSVRLALAVDHPPGQPHELVTRVRDDADGAWRTLHRSLADQDARFIPLAFVAGQASQLYLLADQSDGRLALQRQDITAAAPPQLIAADPVCDIEPVLRDNRLLGYVDPCRGPGEIYLDAGWRHDQAALRQALSTEQVALIDRSADGRRLLLRAAASSAAPPSYWYLDRSGAQPTLTLIADSYPRLTAAQVAPVQRVSFTARDGLSIPALLTLPPGPVQGPLGFVVLPHGGPTAHDSVDFDWLVQFIASRGYGVLQPQFRGSTGFGADFQRAGYGQWGGRMQDDVTDASRWLVSAGLAAPQRLCVVGTSYGGYVALMEAALQASLYRCAAAIAPVTDLRRLLDERQASEFADLARARVKGADDGAPLRAPLDLAADMQLPLLLVHGRQDSVVPIGHSEALERRLREDRLPVESLYLDQADHFFSRPADRLACLQALERFLRLHLGDGGAPA